MDIFKLNTINEIAPIHTDGLKSIGSSLMWLKDDDLDLMLFYKTKEGEEGVVYSEDLPGGDGGELSAFPHIACSEGGVDDSDGDMVSFEKMELNELSPYDKVYFVATNYAELVLKKQINFNDYKAILKISPRYQVIQEDPRFILKLTSEDIGSFLVIGEIEVGEATLILKNLNKVMTLEELKEKIPGAKHLAL